MGLLEDGLGRLGRRRRPGGGVGAQAQVGERGADVDADRALQGVLLVVRVEGVGLVQVLVVERGLDGARGGRDDHGVVRVVRGHHLGGDGKRLLQLLRKLAGLGANGHFKSVWVVFSCVLTLHTLLEAYEIYTPGHQTRALWKPLASVPGSRALAPRSRG